MQRALSLSASLAVLGACGPEDRQAPTTEGLAIEKAPEESGDRQVGVAGRPLPQDLRARVTRDGRPVEGVTVYWTTMQGTMDPPETVTEVGSYFVANYPPFSVWSPAHVSAIQNALDANPASGVPLR